jgi:hypothetical protein
MGLAMNRIVLMMNNVYEMKDVPDLGEWHMGTKAWTGAGCPRGDLQCFFLPPSPCVLSTADMLNKSSVLTSSEYRAFLKDGTFPTGNKYSSAKVLHLKPSLWRPAQHLPNETAKRLSLYAKGIVDSLPVTDPRLPALRRALVLINRTDHENLVRIRRILSIYVLRPNLESVVNIKPILDNMVPKIFDPEIAIGLPIRGRYTC